MEVLLSAPVSTVPLFNIKTLKSAKTRPLHCSRSGSPGDVDLHNHSKPEKEEKRNDIWGLFKEAQQNILYINKQRLLAMEELDRVKNERDSLLDRVKKLEMEKEANVKRDELAISSELLLRIDSLVLNGMISSTEASDLRTPVINLRGTSTDALYDIICKKDDELLAELRHFSKKSKQDGFHIIHICTEMSPVVSVGPLASYITGVSRALQMKGNLVEVILPKYACLNLDEVQGLREIDAEFYSYFNGQLHGNKIWTGVVHGIGVNFIQPIYYSSLFSHDNVYGYPNDFERFTYFSRASLDYLVKSGKRPDVLHIHNWQTSMVGPLFWDFFVNQGFEGTRIVLTCQGFDSQCLEQPTKLVLSGLDPSELLRPDRLQDSQKTHLANILKGGVVYSNKVIMLSSGQTKGQIISASGHGLQPTLDIHKEKLVIAPCGLDNSTWDPSCDSFLPQSYSTDDMKGKSVCKVALQHRLGLNEGASKILVGCIYPDVLDIDLEKLKSEVSKVSKRGVQFVFMGSSQLRHGIRRDENVRFVDEYDEELSHLVISGSDIMLCLSFDDHLFQVPLKAMKYGAAPVPLTHVGTRFRHFGGDDSVETTKLSQYIKYTFANMSLSQAIDEIENNPLQWDRRIQDAMKKDLSWGSECVDVHMSAYEEVKNL